MLKLMARDVKRHGGALGGMAIGGVLGSVLPGIGTVVGMAVGAVVGYVGDKARHSFNSFPPKAG